MSYFDPSESFPATPEQTKEGLRRVDVMMNPYAKPADRQAVEMLVAHEIWRDLSAYTRLEAPKKPDELPLDGQKIVERMRFVKVLAHPKQDDLEMAAMFGAWRCAVLTMESKNAGRLEMLLEAIRIHQRVFDDTGCEGEALSELRAFAESEWRVKLPDPIPGFWEARPFCAAAAQENELMPSWLRRLEDRPMTNTLASVRGFTRAGFSSFEDND